MGSSILKVPGGKLLKINLECANDTISSVDIRGDFFAHPESIMPLIESSLAGTAVDKHAISKEVKKIVEQEQAELYGIDPESIAEAIMMAAQERPGVQQ